MTRRRLGSGFGAVVLLGVSAAGARAVEPNVLAAAWLAAHELVLAVTLGALGWLLGAQLGPARWFAALRPVAASLALGVVPAALAVVPLAFAPHLVWPWASEPLLQPRWFTVFGVELRDGLVLLGLCVLAVLAAWRTIVPRGVAGVSLVVLGSLWSLYVIDTAMTVCKEFRSSITPLMWMASGIVGGLAAIAVLARWRERKGVLPLLPDDVWHAIGRLLLAFELLWAYCAFDQLLIVWIADDPTEVQWYLARVVGGWGAVAWILGVGHAAVFFALLSRSLKRRRNAVAGISIVLLGLRALDAVWVIAADTRTASEVLVIAVPAVLLVAGAAVLVAEALGPKGPDPLTDQTLAYRSA